MAPIKKTKGLWITTITLDPALHGNGVYTNELTSRLSSHFDLDLLYFPQDPLAEEPVNIKQFKNIFYIKKQKTLIPTVCTPDGRNTNINLIDKSVFDWLRLNIKEKGYKFVVCDYIFLSGIFDVLPKEIIKIINTHDIWGDRHIGLNWDNDLRTKTFCCTDKEELISLRKSNLLITISDYEKEVFGRRLKSVRKNIKINTVNYLAQNTKKFFCAKKIKNKLKIGFIGSDNQINTYGVNEFIKFLSKFNLDNLEFHIAGLICEKIEGEFEWIIKKGIIPEDELSNFYKSINLIVNPMQTNSTGLKIKTIAAITNAMPIIGTKDAFSGLEKTSNWHSINNIEELAREVYKISKNPKIIDEIKIASQKAKNEFVKKSELQLSNFISAVENEINSRKNIKDFFKTKVLNSKKFLINTSLDLTLDEIERCNNTINASETRDSYISKLSKVIENRDKLKERNKILEERIKLKNKLIDNIKLKNDENIKIIEDLQKKIQTMNLKFNVKNSDIVNLNKSLEHFKDQIYKRTLVNENLRKNIVNKEKLLNARTEVNKNLQKNITNVQNQLSARTEVNKNLQKNISNFQNKLSARTESNKNLGSKIKNNNLQKNLLKPSDKKIGDMNNKSISKELLNINFKKLFDNLIKQIKN